MVDGEGPHHSYEVVTDQKIPDRPIKITFPEKAETAVRSDIKSRFLVVGGSL